jgi:20S proteasome subunit alpha 7
VLAVEKIVTSKLLKANANKRIATVDRHLGVVSCSALPPSTDPAISRTRPTN